MKESTNEVNPLDMTVVAGRALEQFADAGKSHVNNGLKVVFQPGQQLV